MTGRPTHAVTVLSAVFLMSVALAGPLAAQQDGAGQGETTAQQANVPDSGTDGQDPGGDETVAVLQGLDKTTARVSTFVAPIGELARFGTLEILARACDKKPPTETPESAAYLEIVDVRPDSPAVEVFHGWMFASSPAISALEHPVYDVWVLDCRKRSEVVASGLLTPPAADDQPDAAGDDQGDASSDPEDPTAPPPED